MHPEQRLSTPIVSESVSNCDDLSVAMAVLAFIANTDIAIKPALLIFLCLPIANLILRWLMLRFGVTFLSIQSPNLHAV
jgi:hypothetical protein